MGTTRAVGGLAWVLGGVLGCGAGTQQPGEQQGALADSPQPEAYAGNPQGPPRMESLPSVGVPRSALSEDMQMAIMLSEASFDVDPPVTPGDTHAENLQGWSDTELKAWVRRKSERVEAARAELNQAAEENHRQRIMAGALLGLVYEDVARVLLELPVPDELKSEPEIAEMYREVMVHQARPYVEHARRAYEACAANAREPEQMKPWSRYCATRARRLETPGEAEQLESGETVVEVIREE